LGREESFKRRKLWDTESFKWRPSHFLPEENKGGKGTYAVETVILNIRHVHG